MIYSTHARALNSMSTGRVIDLDCTIRSRDEIDEQCFLAMKTICVRYQ